MDAITLLREHIDIMKLLEHYGFKDVRADGNMIRACCKMHDGNNPTGFVANPDNGLWYCHTGNCGGGDAFTLVQHFEECDFKTAVNFIADFYGIDINNLEIVERKQSYMQEMKKWLKAVSSRKKKDTKAYHIDVPIREVTKLRNFTEETMQHFGLGFVDEINLEKKNGGRYALKNRLYIPIIFRGIQVGASFRKVKATDYPKWSHQPLKLNTGDMLYNYDATDGLKTIVIVEGIFDVWAYHEIGITAVATFGAHITEEQYKLLMRTGADLVFSYDGDKVGKQATEKALEIFRYKANLEYVLFDENEDPESIPREQLKLKYERRKKLC